VYPIYGAVQWPPPISFLNYLTPYLPPLFARTSSATSSSNRSHPFNYLLKKTPKLNLSFIILILLFYKNQLHLWCVCFIICVLFRRVDRSSKVSKSDPIMGKQAVHPLRNILPPPRSFHPLFSLSILAVLMINYIYVYGWL